MRLISEMLAARGLAAFNISYRFSPLHPFPAAVDDCEKAIAYLKYLMRELSIGSSQVADTTLATSVMNEALRTLKPIKDQVHADHREIVVTVTGRDLRTMLGLGSLVDAGSCMHPDYGSRADAIPSHLPRPSLQRL